MDILVVFAIIAAVIGLIGSIVPGIPGPIVGWLGVLGAYIYGGEWFYREMPLWLLLLTAVLTVIVTVTDLIIPAKMTKATGGSKWASRGTWIGLIGGIIFTPVGMILGAFLGAFFCEITFAKKRSDEALNAAIGSFLGFITGTGLKLVFTFALTWIVVMYL